MTLSKEFLEEMRQDFEKNSSEEYKKAIGIVGRYFSNACEKPSEEELRKAYKIIEKELGIKLYPIEEDIIVNDGI